MLHGQGDAPANAITQWFHIQRAHSDFTLFLLSFSCCLFEKFALKCHPDCAKGLTGNSDGAFSLFLANNHSECRKRCGLRDEHLGEIAALRAGVKTIFVARASSGAT
jgi:hypothetical protein